MGYSKKTSKLSVQDRMKFKRMGEMRGEIKELEKVVSDTKKYGVSEHKKALEWVLKDRKKNYETLFKDLSIRFKSS